VGATAFDGHLAINKVVAAFALWIGECTALLEAGLEDITLDSPDNKTQALDVMSREQRR
jgi:hypothetical protein